MNSNTGLVLVVLIIAMISSAVLAHSADNAYNNDHMYFNSMHANHDMMYSKYSVMGMAALPFVWIIAEAGNL